MKSDPCHWSLEQILFTSLSSDSWQAYTSSNLFQFLSNLQETRTNRKKNKLNSPILKYSHLLKINKTNISFSSPQCKIYQIEETWNFMLNSRNRKQCFIGGITHHLFLILSAVSFRILLNWIQTKNYKMLCFCYADSLGDSITQYR